MRTRIQLLEVKKGFINTKLNKQQKLPHRGKQTGRAGHQEQTGVFDFLQCQTDLEARVAACSQEWN